MERIFNSLKDINRRKVLRDLFCLITYQIKTWVNLSGQIQARIYDTITKVLYLIYTVRHFATPFLVFFSFLDLTISDHVTQISDFLRYRKIKVTRFFRGCQILEGSDKFSQSYDHYKILCKLASGQEMPEHAGVIIWGTWSKQAARARCDQFTETMRQSNPRQKMRHSLGAFI